MGPMGPRGLGPWALWAPGALGPNYENFEICQKLLLRTSNDPWDTSQMVLKNFGNLSKFFSIFSFVKNVSGKVQEGPRSPPDSLNKY